MSGIIQKTREIVSDIMSDVFDTEYSHYKLINSYVPYGTKHILSYEIYGYPYFPFKKNILAKVYFDTNDIENFILMFKNIEDVETYNYLYPDKKLPTIIEK